MQPHHFSSSILHHIIIFVPRLIRYHSQKLVLLCRFCLGLLPLLLSHLLVQLSYDRITVTDYSLIFLKHKIVQTNHSLSCKFCINRRVPCFQLNEVLVPNPFDRPRAVFVLEVTGAEDSQLLINSDNTVFGSSLKSLVSDADTEAHIQLSDEEVSVLSLNEDSECSDRELKDFASLLGGSYVADALNPLNGELIIPIVDGDHLQFHLTEDAERKFVTMLVSLMSNIQKFIKNHQDISQSEYMPAELITGKFDGIQALQDVYGADGSTQQGLALFSTTVSKIFKMIQKAYKGQIVGVILSTGGSLPDSKNMLKVESTSRTSSRSLKEEVSPIIILEVALVRKSIAWITGIILLIATSLGVHFLLNMPITKDTLLYSNVKLD